MKTATEKVDVYAAVTNRIVEMLEAGARPWHQPWKGKSPSRPMRVCGKPYSGINALILWIEAVDKGYSSPTWMTFNQARELGGTVRKGEHGTVVVYANTFTKKETDESTGEEISRTIPFLKTYYVFNCDQIDGLKESKPESTEAIELPERLDNADRFFARTGITLNHGGNQAYYHPASDRIQMPEYSAFESREAYYSTLSHEMVHATKHPTRLNRDLGGKRFGDDGYAMEELVAEIGAAFVCADLGITPEVQPEHASYLASWLRVLKADKRAIFTAASHATKAAEWLSGVNAE